MSLLLLVAGGGLCVYGLMQRAKTRPMRKGEGPEGAPWILHKPDEEARTEGNIALVLGIVSLLGGFFWS